MWVKKGLIYNVRGEHEWNKSHAHVVCADNLDDGKSMRLIFSTRNSSNQCQATSIVVNTEDFSVITDIDSQPMMGLGRTGTFDDCGVMPTWLVRDGERRLLYYIGWTVRNTIPYHNSLGLAVSYDGKRYVRLGEGPVMTSTFMEPFFVASACIFKEKDQWIAWYLSCVGWIKVEGKQEPIYNIKYATSADGINWNRTGIVCIELKENEGGISRPTVVREDGIFKMWYSYRGRENFKAFSDQSYRIGYAESTDGIKWRRLDHEAGISVSPQGWDSDMIEYPLVISLNNRKVMFYNGNGFGRTGFGYAVWEK